MILPWATMDDIAKLAGVSKTTVSRVLSGNPNGASKATREKIKTIAKELDYTPNLLARGVATSKTKTIGVIIPDITNPFFAELIKSIESNANKKGYIVFIGTTELSPEKEEKYLLNFICKRVDGIILTSVVNRDSSVHGIIAKHRIPYVLLDRDVRMTGLCAGVFIDNKYSVYKACAYLLNNGNRKIAYLSGPLEFSTSIERIEGYQIALEENGIKVDRDLIREGNYTLESGYQAVKALDFERKEYTALLAANDTMALGAMAAIQELGYRVPEEVEVIGFDNIFFSEISNPPLTTVAQPIEDMGKYASDLLFRMIRGEKIKKRTICLEAKLIRRRSTK